MSVEQFQQTLADCFNGTEDYHQKLALDRANSYTEMMKAGQLNKDEYVALMEDVSRMINIDQSVAHQELMINMNTAINGLISLAKLA